MPVAGARYIDKRRQVHRQVGARYMDRQEASICTHAE
jgi:hypothetical protein